MKATIALLAMTGAILVGCVAQDGEVSTSSSSALACQTSDNEIFVDCLSPSWQMAVYDDAETETFFSGEAALPNTFFHAPAVEAGGSNKVIDVEYFQVTGFSSFQLYPSVAQTDSTEAFTTVDLSVYENGTLSFDLRILDHGMSELGLFVTLQCGWPCRSRFFPVANKTGINSLGLGEFPLVVNDTVWRHVEIPMTYFLEDNGDASAPNLDITAVNTIVFAPGWASDTELKGFHFQVDNIVFKQ